MLMLRGTKLLKDLIDAKTGEAVATAGTKMTPRTLRNGRAKLLIFWLMNQMCLVVSLQVTLSI